MNFKACCGLLASKDDEDYDYEDVEQEPLPKPQRAAADPRKKVRKKSRASKFAHHLIIISWKCLRLPSFSLTKIPTQNKSRWCMAASPRHPSLAASSSVLAACDGIPLCSRSRLPLVVVPKLSTGRVLLPRLRKISFVVHPAKRAIFRVFV